MASSIENPAPSQDLIFMETDPVRILWTGGWDSTFQILMLVEHGMCVEPVYLIDEDRVSTLWEIRAMKAIRSRLETRYPKSRSLVLPTRFHAVGDIRCDPAISGAYRRVCSRSYVGGQYEWLARFCTEYEIQGLQLCIHKDDRAHKVIQGMVREVRWRGMVMHAISEDFAQTDEFVLFRYYTFPVLNLTKRDMETISRERGWTDIMGLTWFCHRPRGKSPCGTCNPCLYTVEEGLGWRIPLHRRWKSFFMCKGIRPLKTFLRGLLHGPAHSRAG